MIRALALRTMSYIQIEPIISTLLDPLKEGLKDSTTGSGAAPRKNSSGVLKGRLALAANPLYAVSAIVGF